LRGLRKVGINRNPLTLTLQTSDHPLTPSLLRRGNSYINYINMTLLNNQERLKITRKELRNNSTNAEKILWEHLK